MPVQCTTLKVKTWPERDGRILPKLPLPLPLPFYITHKPARLNAFLPRQPAYYSGGVSVV